MNLADYEYPDESYTPRRKASQAVAAQHRMRVSADVEPMMPRSARSSLPFSIGALMLIVLMIGAATWQLGRMPAALPLQITPAADHTAAAVLAHATPTMAATTAPLDKAPDPRYDRQLAGAILAGFGKQPRDLDVGGRRFMLLSCEGWECQIELDDGTQVWVGVEQAGEAAPTPEPPPRPNVRLPVMVCADASGLNGSAHICAPDGNYNALLQEAQAQAGPPISAPPTLDPNVLATATQRAINGDATAVAVQTAQALPTPVAAQQVR